MVEGSLTSDRVRKTPVSRFISESRELLSAPDSYLTTPIYLYCANHFKLMKKTFTLIALLFLSFSAKAQMIDSLVVTPAMPDANDTLRIYAYLSFPQGSCVDIGTANVAGNNIYGYSFHCMGMAMFICNDVDTVVIPPLAVGTYTLTWALDAGYGNPGNCTPGFQPYDFDTLIFQVSTVLDVPVLTEVEAKLFPNPASDNLSVQISEGIIEQIQLVNVIGEEVYSVNSMQSRSEIPTGSLADGMYFCRITDAQGRIFVQQVEIVH